MIQLHIKAKYLRIFILANTLKIIAEKGRKGFYEGKIAKTISNLLDQGGFLSYDDLKVINLNGLNQYLQIIVVMIYGNYHQMDKE